MHVCLIAINADVMFDVGMHVCLKIVLAINKQTTTHSQNESRIGTGAAIKSFSSKPTTFSFIMQVAAIAYIDALHRNK